MDAKVAAKLFLNLQKRIQESESQTWKQGYIATIDGPFVEEVVVQEMKAFLQSLREDARSNEEWLAESTRLTWFLRSIVDLAAAREVCLEVVERIPAKSFVAFKALSYIEANRGDVESANGWAARANELSPSRAYRVSSQEIERELVIGQEYRDRLSRFSA